MVSIDNSQYRPGHDIGAFGCCIFEMLLKRIHGNKCEVGRLDDVAIKAYWEVTRCRWVCAQRSCYRDNYLYSNVLFQLISHPRVSYDVSMWFVPKTKTNDRCHTDQASSVK